jgi:hypothetical protein
MSLSVISGKCLSGKTHLLLILLTSMSSLTSTERSAYSLNIPPNPPSTDDHKRNMYYDDMCDDITSDGGNYVVVHMWRLAWRVTWKV